MIPPLDDPSNVAYRLGVVERDFQEHKKQVMDKMDRLIWAFITLTITIASAAIVFALTVLLSGRTNP